MPYRDINDAHNPPPVSSHYINDDSSTPFDDVFKTETEKMGHLLITVIEQMFHVKAEIISQEEIERLANERYFIDEISGKISKRITDTCFKIGGRFFHIECQSTEDGSILFRLAEYNVRIALDDASLNDDKTSISIQLPSSGLINLRCSSAATKFSQMEIIYTYNDQQIIMPVPVMNVQAFSADDIFDNGLYFLIPFYAMRYESRFRKISDSEDPEYDKIYRELKDYFDRLLKACEVGVISENDTRNLAELSRIILKHIARKLDPDLRERMENLMGGHVLELQEDRWLKQGIELGKSEGVEIGLAQGRLEGIEQGRLEGSKFLLYSLVKDKLMDVSIAAKKDGSSVEIFTKDMDAYFAKKGQQSDSDKKQ